jgi:hypothetical protein
LFFFFFLNECLRKVSVWILFCCLKNYSHFYYNIHFFVRNIFNFENCHWILRVGLLIALRPMLKYL